MRKIIMLFLTVLTIPMYSYITVTSPNGGETLYRGTSFVITWSDNISEDVRIDLYQNGSYLLPIISSTPSDGSYTADIPNELYGSNYKIRITSTTVPTTFDYSDGYFSVDIGHLDIITPAGTEELIRGSSFEITWNSSNFQENVLITLNDSGTPIDTIAVSAANNGSFMWYVPLDIYGKNFTVKIASKLYPSIYDESSTFIIEEGYVTLTSPTGGMILEMLADTLITWNDNIPEGVIIELRKAGVVKKTLSSASNGSMRWNFYDPELITGSDYSIRIISAIFSTVYSQSSNFTIKGTPVSGGSISGTWIEANSPYILSDSVYVETANTLNIEPGVTLHDVGLFGLTVNGHLNASGSYENAILFKDTSIKINNSASSDSSVVENAVLEIDRAINFSKNYGGSNSEYGRYVIQSTDGGYIIAGYTNSFGAGSNDVYLIKTDSNGNQVWYKTFGGADFDTGQSVAQTTDGGYIIAGNTYSYGAGDSDVYLIKTDSVGNQIWDKTFGGAGNDTGQSVAQTTDGGYIIAGYTNSYGAGSNDVYLIKTDSNGNQVWYKTFGGADSDIGYSVIRTTDRGYIITGYTYSFGAGGYDVYLIKTDSNGNQVWYKTFGGADSDIGYSAIRTTDRGYIITGYTYSESMGNYDLIIIKTDSEGNQLWYKTFGDDDTVLGRSVAQTTDGGYIITGYILYSATYSDVYLIKTDSEGNQLWDKTFGGASPDIGCSVAQTTDGGYIIAGESDHDVFLIKTDGFEDNCLEVNNNSKFIIRNSMIKNANEYGILINNASPVLSNNLIAGNRHGIKLTGSSSQYIVNNTIADNDSIGVFLDGNSDAQFINNIIFGNGLHQVYLNDDLSDPSFYYNDIQGGIAGFGLNTGVTYNGSNSGNIDINPLFVSGTYELQSISQCKDTGYPGLTEQTLGSLYIPQTDMAGNPRLYGSNIDMGCYEYYVPVITPDSPTNVTISVSFGTLTIEWDDMPNANSYLIYSSNDPYGTFDYLATVSQSQWSIIIGTDTKKFYNVVSSSENAKAPKPPVRKIELNKH
ncbi:MAG: Ser-Thr-rich GPI-anchored membrane family protein [Candidatus Delongbacteria bacterium]|jgi:parallel beta-helix repeat protein|nr:Ser-Thr-rich GPI-anchored membrane family protein [Candidatus Delongbacteria bacterium]